MNTEIFENNGKILMLALDHRGSFRKFLNPQNPEGADKDLAIKIKSEIIDSVYGQMSGVLVDQVYGLPAYKTLNPNNKPYLLPSEKTGYSNSPKGERITEIQYSAKQIKNDGGSGVKLLIYFNPNGETTKTQIETSGKVLEDAHSQNMPFFLEIVTYGQPERKAVVVESVKQFIEAGVVPDVFKIEYPGSPEACNMIKGMVGETPWILLTRGGEFDSFVEHLQHAVNSGCSGFLAGRSLWQEAVSIRDTKERILFLRETTAERFKTISSIVLG